MYEERCDYQSPKQALLRCMGTLVTRRLDQVVGVIKRKKKDTIAEICEERQHVNSFLSPTDTAADVKFN